MSKSPCAETPKTMPFTDLYNKIKRPRLLEPSLGILALTVCLILFFYLLDYKTVTKLVVLPSRTEGVLWLRVGGQDGENLDSLRAEKGDFLRGECDMSDGDWVWDESYPLYNSSDCRFLDEGFRCNENGRPDSFYTKWRWQPKDCILPRFNAKAMLEKMRNKRIVFAGDSIGRNQWESLLCMLSRAVPDRDAIYEAYGNPITKHKGFLVFRFRDYNCSVEYYRAPFLVLQSRAPANVPMEVKLTLKLDKMDWMSSRWKDADVLVFNTGHWWNHEKTARGGCYFQEGQDVKMDMSADIAYGKALETVIEWVQREVNTRKTQVVFRTLAPVHFRGGDWRSGGACQLETLPDLGSSMVPSQAWTKYNILAQVSTAHTNASSDSRPLDMLNITHMTARRKDGHPSLYYLGPTIVAPVHRQDCSHWCLPGIPDAWNELLYALVLRREAIRSASNLTTFHLQV